MARPKKVQDEVVAEVESGEPIVGAAFDKEPSAEVKGLNQIKTKQKFPGRPNAV